MAWELEGWEEEEVERRGVSDESVKWRERFGLQEEEEEEEEEVIVGCE